MTATELDQLAKAKTSAMASLAMREHSVLELQHKLLRKNFPEDIVLSVVSELQQQNLLSNERFAEVYWRQRAEKGFGPVKIRHELQQKGLEDTTIQQGLLAAEVNFEALIQRVYQKKYHNKPCQDLKEKAKRQGFLYRRGFTADAIRSVLDEADGY